jgi:hypothetical protein
LGRSTFEVGEHGNFGSVESADSGEEAVKEADG